MLPFYTSIHPLRPRIADTPMKNNIPKDLDGAYRARNRLDGKSLKLPAQVYVSYDHNGKKITRPL